MSRLTVFAVLSILFSSVLGLSSAQSPATPDPLFNHNETVHIPDGTVLVEGDIVMPEEHLHTRGAYQTWFWPGGVVYYEFAPYITQEKRDAMYAAMDELESVADVTFVPRVSEPNYIYVVEDGGNWSYIGMVRGMQELSIYNWNYKYIIVHELMHALGIWHEQSRTDRDDYITINYSNIFPGYQQNFEMRAGSLAYGSYDFCSVMHYDPLAFSYNGEPTIAPKPGYEAAAACMGNRDSMTAQDHATVAFLYDSSTEIPGDRPATALDITGGYYTHSAASSTFGISPDEPLFACSSGGMAVTNTVWYRITPDKGHYIEVFASGYDTVVGIYSGTPDGNDLFLEACSDYYGAGIEEWIGLPLEAGVSYYIGVGSWVGSSGLLEFEAHGYHNVLVDSSLDWEKNVWKRTAVPTTRIDDKLKCGRFGVFNSLCALKFKGGVGEGTTFRQTILPGDGLSFSVGDQLAFAYLIASASPKNKVMGSVIITYMDGSKQKIVVPAAIGIFNSYTFMFNSAELTQSGVKKIVVKVANKSTGGKTFVDNILLLPTQLSPRLGTARQRGAAPTKPQTFAPIADQRGAQSSVLPVPPPAN
jgi:hypothetical protein